VSRVGIEPTTLGLKGRTGMSDALASLPKLSPMLDISRQTIPRVIQRWQIFRSSLLTGC